MTSVRVPDEAIGQLGAILLAFNREIFGSLLDEADELAELGQATSVVLIAGTVLNYSERGSLAGVLTPELRRQMAEWRDLRDQAAHGSAGALSARQARRILKAAHAPGESGHHLRAEVGGDAGAFKGRYTSVSTSREDFIGRKCEEIDLEDRK